MSALLSPAPVARRRPRRNVVRSVVIYAILAAGLPIVLTPFLLMLTSSLKSVAEVMVFPPTFFPQETRWQNYVELFEQVPKFSRFFANSLFVAGSVVVLEVLTSSLAAYAFAWLRFPWRDRVFLLYLGTLMIPGQVTIIPGFILISKFGWLDTYWALIIPAAFTAFGTFLLRQHFMSIPRELVDAAKVDGASHLRIYATIVMPLAKPAIATLAVLAFMAQWNNFLGPLIVTNSENMRTLTLALRFLASDPTTIGNPNLLMAGTAISVLPMLLLFFVAQKYFIRGITVTGIGGR